MSKKSSIKTKKKSSTVTPRAKKTNSKEERTNKKVQFPIIGIGASAGGFEAMEQFFTNCPIATTWLSSLFSILTQVIREYWQNFYRESLL